MIKNFHRGHNLLKNVGAATAPWLWTLAAPRLGTDTLSTGPAASRSTRSGDSGRIDGPHFGGYLFAPVLDSSRKKHISSSIYEKSVR